MTRKQKLETRANRYGKRQVLFGSAWAHFATGYEDGYRAAMRDLRKCIRRAGRDTAHIKDPFKRVMARDWFVAAEVKNFLKQLR